MISAKLTSDDIVLTSLDFVERLDFIRPKSSHTLQERTEHLLHFGVLLRMRILDIFGSLLYVYYDNFSVAEVEALHKVYQEIFNRRYNIFSLIPGILKKETIRPSEICDEIYAHVKSCLRNSATVCSRIKKHNLLDLDDLETSSGLNVTFLVYRLSKLSKQYPRGFSLEALLRFLEKEVLTITPGLLSGLLYHVRYESYDDEVRLAERELVRHFHEMQITESSSTIILKQLTTRELKKFHSVNSLFRYYMSIYIENISDDNLKRHAFLLVKRIADDIGTIDENILLLGNVYEDRMIHVKYLFDLVLPDDVLDKDVIDAKKFLVKKLEKFNVVERYLRVHKYQQLTPAQLALEITGQLRDIDFVKDIAISLHMHAKYWRSSHMIETLPELLQLFDAYENLRHVLTYQDMMQKIDQIKESLSAMKDVPVEILCNAPRTCLQIGLQSVLRCKLVSSEIKNLIRDFFKLSNMCVDIKLENRVKNIPLTLSRVKVTTKVMNATTKTIPMTTTPLSTSETKTESFETSEESTEKVTKVSEIAVEPKTTTESVSISTPIITTKFKMPKMTTTMMKTETSTITTELPAITDTESPTTTTTESPTTTTTEPSTTITTESSTITTTELLTTTTTEPTTTTTEPPTTTTTEPSTTITTESSTVTTTELLTTTTTEPTTTTTEPTTTTTEPPTTTTTEPSTTITTESPTITTIELPATTTTEPTTTTTEPPTTITTEPPTTITKLPKKTTTELPKTTITISPTTTTKLPITSTTLLTTSPATSTTISLTTEKIPTIDMELSRSKVELSMSESEEISTTTSLSKECESNECGISLKKIVKNVTSAPTTKKVSSIPFKIFKTYHRLTTKKIIPETTTAMTELHETTTKKEYDCVTRSCSEECESETVESATKSCEVSCDSEEDCDEEESLIENVSKKMENHTIECHKQCEQESSEISSGCETDKSCECASTDEKSAECVTLCRSDSSSCEDDQDNCSMLEMPTIDIKLNRRQQNALCEIRDFHHRRQKSRLAKMRAISAAAVASHTDVLRSRTSRRRPRIMTKKLYNLLAAELPRSKDKKSKRITEYLLKRSGLNKIKGDGRKRRKEREEIYRLRKKMARKLKNKRLSGDAYGQPERIPKQNVISKH
ncbi:probable serine/threonine-protein kinase nek3 [Pseudomyrmex gracilis]|uniref:probable serine/threonine-protein kinase nek3 n=1 Tax=Pseudomyrmex gracilis TaxID=219809 RepID=UPI000994A69F|nr:probable serine/threonine-protein kinase nek3 [Pseudomyrmex gracilis]